ncbi:MAG TPA: hypothetical protein ENH55_08330 [Aurantimonas coralicida]|uniref:Uncharacterized protein n=1 Tax=marine sediment metagenome TaxID=412755 RepID=A0A0F9SXR1_9ZZZZ|nr:hypothetical protein [Aurantimonas coralicida]
MTETIGDTLGGVPLDEIEILDCRCADGAIVKARPRKDLPWPAVFMGTHPERGLCFFRVRHRGAANGGAGAVEVWECTEAVRRALARRRQRANARAKDGEARRLQKRHRKVEVKPGLPTPERRRHGPVAREAIPNLEDEHGGSPNVTVHRAPDRLVAMHKRGTLTSAQLEAAERFHRAFIAGACDPGRVANLHRIPGAEGAALPDAMLDAKHEVFAIYDHLGGRDRLAARMLMHVVGLDRTIEDCVREERGRDNWVNKHRAVGVLASALDSVCGYYATRTWLESLRRRALEGAEIGVLSQGA